MTSELTGSQNVVGALMTNFLMTVDAATAGVVGGFWPETLEFKGRKFTRSHSAEDDRGRIISVIYRGRSGASLEVLR